MKLFWILMLKFMSLILQCPVFNYGVVNHLQIRIEEVHLAWLLQYDSDIVLY